MVKFNSNKISVGVDSVGEQLRQARQEQKIKLETAAQKLNINLKYLEALENGQIEKLPAGIYGKNFLREYARFLNINDSELLEIFNNENPDKQNKKQKNLFSKKIPRAHYFLTIPRIVKNIIIAIIVLILLAYLGYSLKKIISPPKLIITEPIENFTTEKYNVNIQGFTDPEAKIIINGEPILTDTNGYFIKKIHLKNGLNTITITAQEKYSRKNNVIRKVLVK